MFTNYVLLLLMMHCDVICLTGEFRHAYLVLNWHLNRNKILLQRLLINNKGKLCFYNSIRVSVIVDFLTMLLLTYTSNNFSTFRISSTRAKPAFLEMPKRTSEVESFVQFVKPSSKVVSSNYSIQRKTKNQTKLLDLFYDRIQAEHSTLLFGSQTNLPHILQVMLPLDIFTFFFTDWNKRRR